MTERKFQLPWVLLFYWWEIIRFLNCYKTMLGIIVISGMLLNEAMKGLDLSNLYLNVQLRSAKEGKAVHEF